MPASLIIVDHFASNRRQVMMYSSKAAQQQTQLLGSMIERVSALRSERRSERSEIDAPDAPTLSSEVTLPQVLEDCLMCLHLR